MILLDTNVLIETPCTAAASVIRALSSGERRKRSSSVARESEDGMGRDCSNDVSTIGLPVDGWGGGSVGRSSRAERPELNESHAHG